MPTGWQQITFPVWMCIHAMQLQTLVSLEVSLDAWNDA